MEGRRIDEMIINLPRKDKIKILKEWKEYMKELSLRSGKPAKGKKKTLGGERIMKRRILWLKKSLKKKK